jgi:hypothetical protein
MEVLDILVDAVKDTLYLIPFLFVTYVAMEWLEHSASDRFRSAIERGGVAGPAIGSVLGVVPQCGFSAAASTLYAARVITLGTLIAVFLSTSDEMLPIFIAESVPVPTILSILGVKIVLGMAAGFVVDAIMRITRPAREAWRIYELCERAHCHCECDDIPCIRNAQRIVSAQDEADGRREGVVGYGDDAGAANSGAADSGVVHDHDHGHSHGRRWATILKSAARHTAEVSLFVFLVVLALNVVFTLMGEDALAGFLNSSPKAAVLVSALVGLIPNCAASVAIAQLYVDGLLGAGAMMAGLLSAAGVGLLVLFRTNSSARQNVIILVILWGIASVCGLAIDFLGIVF